MKKKLKEVCRFYAGTGFPVKYQGKENDELPFFKVGDIASNVNLGNTYLDKCNNYISKVEAKEIKGTIIPTDTVVFAKIGEALKLNRRAITSAECLIDNNAMGIAPIEEKLDLKYFFYYMKNLKMEQLSESTTVPSVRKSKLEDAIIYVPDLEKQEIVGNILDKVNELIQLRMQQLLDLDILIKSRFVEMFGDPNAEESKWEKKPLGELCTIVRGGSPRPIEKFLGGEIPWIKIGDATQGDNIYLHSTKEHIIEEGVNKSRYVKKGSMIFANCGVSLGFARIITFDGCIHDGWLAFQDIDERLNDIFLLKALNMCTDYFRRTAPDGTQPNLNTAIMKIYLQIIPPIENQKEFVRFSEQVDKLKVEE